ncbi:hypothetical protein ACQYHE_005436, partial [Escherichia coli]
PFLTLPPARKVLSKDEQGHSSGAGPGADGHIFTLSENGSFMPVGVFAPCQKKQPVSDRKGNPTQQEKVCC